MSTLSNKNIVMTITSLTMVITFIVYIEHHHFLEELCVLSGAASSLITNITHSYNTNLILIISIVIVALLDIIIFTYQMNQKKKLTIRRMKGDMNEIQAEIATTKDNYTQKLTEVSQKLELLIKKDQTVINRQKEELASKNNRIKEHTKDIAAISDGLKSLYYILNNEEDLKLDKQQIENITKCYSLIDEDFVTLLEHLNGKPITPKEEMLCILWRIGKDKESVMKILGLSKDGYRQLKFRTLKKLKQETSFKHFCDNLE